MSRPATYIEVLRQGQRYRNRIIALLLALLLLHGVAYWRIPTTLHVYVPPDLTRPQTLAVGEIPPSYVYAFAKIILETLNYCPKDCGVDYVNNLDSLRHYLTPSCFQDLSLHRERHHSLYQHRSRRLLPLGDELFNPDRITRLDRNAWTVTVDYLLEEHVVGVETRRNRYRYPLRVVHYNLPVHLNAYQLAFDCYTGAGPHPVDSAGGA